MMDQAPEPKSGIQAKLRACLQRVIGGIRARLLFLMLIILVPIFAAETFSYVNRFETQKEQEFSANLEVARAVGMAFEVFIQDVHRQELAIGIALTASPPLSSNDVQRLLEESKGDYPPIRDFSWIGPKGRVLASSKKDLLDADVSGRAFFKKLASPGKGWVVSNVIQSEATGEPVFVIGRALYDANKEFLGAAIATVQGDMLDHVLAMHRPHQGSILLLDQSGTLVYRFPHTGVKEGERGEKSLLASAEIPSIGWVAGAGRPEQVVIRPILSSLSKDALLFLSISLLALLASLAMAQSISGPVVGLQREAKAFRKENMDIHAELRGPSEVRDLAHIFNEMGAQIRLWVGEAEHRAAEAEEGKRILDALMKYVPEGMIIVDLPDYRVRRVSRSVRTMWGDICEGNPLPYPSGEISVFGRDGLALNRLDLPLVRAIIGEEEITDTELVFRKNGSEMIVLCNSAPIRDDKGRTTGGIAIWRDITDRKRMENELRRSRDQMEDRVRERTLELEAMNEALRVEVEMRRLAEEKLKVHATELEKTNKELDNFVRLTSHDLQEPLRKIQTLGDLLEMSSGDRLTGEAMGYLRRIRVAAARMRDLLQSLLLYSRLNEKAEPVREVDLTQILLEVLRALEGQVKETAGDVRIGEMPRINAAPGQLTLLFRNLIGNALKFHRPGEPPQISITAGYTKCPVTGGGIHEIRVKDNGIGFDPQYLDKIFMPFQQLHGRDEYGGVGMGLAISRKIVERHGGNIRAESTPGCGSTFIVTLPGKQNQ